MPEEFNEWEHLQSTVMSAYNRFVREEFRDSPDDDGISTPRGSLRVACLGKDNDSAPMLAIRMLLFYFTVGKAQALQRPVYGYPTGSVDEVRKFRPQVTLHFSENYEDVDLDDGFQPVYGQCSFRLMNETSTSLTESELRSLGQRIKTNFGVGVGFIWRKGRQLLTYTDKDGGLSLQVSCISEAEGRRVVQEVVGLTPRTLDWSNANYKENLEASEAFPTNPGSQTILGRSRKKPRRRPVATVIFRYATIAIHGLPNPIILYDKTGRYRNALVTDF